MADLGGAVWVRIRAAAHLSVVNHRAIGDQIAGQVEEAVPHGIPLARVIPQLGQAKEAQPVGEGGQEAAQRPTGRPASHSDFIPERTLKMQQDLDGNWQIKMEVTDLIRSDGTNRIVKYLTKESGALLELAFANLEHIEYHFVDTYRDISIDSSFLVDWNIRKGEKFRHVHLQEVYIEIVRVKKLNKSEVTEALFCLSKTIGDGINMLQRTDERYLYSIAGWRSLRDAREVDEAEEFNQW